MTAAEVTRAAMYLLAKRQGISVRNRARVEKHWAEWHPCVHRALRKQIRESLRAMKWAGLSVSDPKGGA